MHGQWRSRRSPVLSTRGVVACSQPLAAQIGVSILEKGGNAADAAVAVAAALNMTEPTSTGIGGDCFCLFYDAKEQKVKGLNGSGRSPSGLSIPKLRELGVVSASAKKLPTLSVHTITVPGAAAGWADTVERFGSGKLTLEDVLMPAIEMGERGFPVAPVTAYHWNKSVDLLRQNSGGALLIDGEAPKAGELIRMPELAATFRELGKHGKKGFYEGRIADAIIGLIQSLGGVMTHEDLIAHRSTFDDPISTTYEGVTVYEIPPNGQGITALVALNMLKTIKEIPTQLAHNSAAYLHTLIECMRLAFIDTRYYVGDPAKANVPIKELLSEEYAKSRLAQYFSFDKACADLQKGSPFTSSDTVYFCVVDEAGNACSFINSNYMGFGTGLVPKGCGFTLQNRGLNFTLREGRPNSLEPNKRPYHTIIPGMATIKKPPQEAEKEGGDGEELLYCAFGVMGGFMQPQGHVQVLLNMLAYGMDPQAALDAPRFCIRATKAKKSVVAIEDGVAEEEIKKLRQMGHTVEVVSGADRAEMGRGQIIRRHPATNVMWAGSDPRADGAAIPRV